MCGIAGRILPAPGRIGEDLVELMDAQEHRGADSTGFAVYGRPHSKRYIIRGMGFDKDRLDKDFEKFFDILREHGGDLVQDPQIYTDENKHYGVRFGVFPPRKVGPWLRDADAMASEFEVQSFGRSLEIIKDIGGADQVAEKYRVRDMIGTHGLGHARLATESSVLPNASHPFWARPFPDVAIVHNGQITNYYLTREKLKRHGYNFLTENDSELIAVWVSDQIKKGLRMKSALRKSVREIDGVFTYLISYDKGIGLAKDKFAMKPLVVIKRDGGLAAATEEQAVRRVFTSEFDVINYDGPSTTRIWRYNHLRQAA